jgi:hypothetical protein
MKLTTHFHLVSRLRKSGGAMPLVLLYAFMAWTGTRFFFSVRSVFGEL